MTMLRQDYFSNLYLRNKAWLLAGFLLKKNDRQKFAKGSIRSFDQSFSNNLSRVGSEMVGFFLIKRRGVRFSSTSSV